MTNSIVYRYDPKQSKVVAIKLDYAESEKLSALAQFAKLYVPFVEALKRDSTLLFESVELDLPNLPIVLKVVNVPERDQ